MNSPDAYYTIQDAEDGVHIQLQGNWVIAEASALMAALKKLGGKNARTKPVVSIDARGLARMDSWGSLRLKSLWEGSQATVYLTDQQKRVFELMDDDRERPKPAPPPSLVFQMFFNLGEMVVNGTRTAGGIMTFIGEIAVCFAKNLMRPGAFRFHSIVRHIDETGLRALPIIGLLAILISMVISYQASMQLEKFGANIFTIDLTVISLLREMGVLITAIMVAGRSGSAFAAEIGVMKMREEVDALKTMGMDPIEVLILPRLIALLMTLPLLTFLADIIGLAGGSIISVVLLDIPLDQYIARVLMVANTTMFFVGIVKAPVFAFIITIVGCYHGMNATGSAESVGRLTTISVVQSIFLVIMADAVFSILFAQMGI